MKNCLLDTVLTRSDILQCQALFRGVKQLRRCLGMFNNFEKFSQKKKEKRKKERKKKEKKKKNKREEKSQKEKKKIKEKKTEEKKSKK